MRTDRRAPIAAMALALAALGGCGQPAPSQDAGREIAEAFLGEIRAGRVDEAWASTTAEFKSMLGAEGLRAYVKRHPSLNEPAEFVALKPEERNGLPMAEASFRPKDGEGLVKVLLGREAGAWKVERLAVE